MLSWMTITLLTLCRPTAGFDYPVAHRGTTVDILHGERVSFTLKVTMKF